MSLTKVASYCQNRKAPEHNGDPKYCNACKKVYCDTCYDMQLVHEDESDEHEKTGLDIANFILSLFDTGNPVEERELQHQKNIYSKWFGMAIDEQERRSYFHDFGGFARLLQDSDLTPQERFPSLISFVGDTGAGKSTLINGILKLPAEITRRIPEDVLSPVMGASYEQCIPTSGDVHLFRNSEARETQPMYYADCEGMSGGESPPAATTSLGKRGRISGFVHKRREMFPPITRKWAVRELYPRILFPFSDVICYVTRNARCFEHHLEMLLLWADRAIDKTTNQPILPHAFLVINAFAVEESPKSRFQDWWDVDQVTLHFLTEYQDLIKFPSSRIGKLANVWNSKRGRNISSLEQLIKCYYRDFKIICIPEIRFSQHSRITTQYQRLQSAIAITSERCRRSRQASGFLMCAETLQRYLEMAFDHFTATPNEPFNFLSAALLRSPVTQTLKDHICNLAVQYMTIYPEKTGSDLFEELAQWVATCIFLNSHRFELPKNDDADVIFEGYQDFCKTAQTEFYDRSWTCEAVDKNGNRCVNIKSTHTAKGHQNCNGDIFFAKDPCFRLVFKSSFETITNKKQANEAFSMGILAKLKDCIRKYRNELTDKDELDRDGKKKAVADIHKSMFQEFRKRGVMKDLVSHKTCFCCLASSPAHKLFCSHIVCQLCFEDYSTKGDNILCCVLKECPLCLFKGTELKIEMKPPTAGLRILCLDGGGIRSIMQLEILKQLECQLGHMVGPGIPIQNFFDLIVGTSGGGVVAAGIGLKHLSTGKCIEMFADFADRAFKKRPAIDWPFLGQFVMAHHHGRYKTSGLKHTLQDIFGPDPIFGAEMNHHNGVVPSLKVAVTASSNRRTFLLTNYNRPPLEKKCSINSKKDEDDSQNDNTKTDDDWIASAKDKESIVYGEIDNDSETHSEIYEKHFGHFEDESVDSEYFEEEYEEGLKEVSKENLRGTSVESPKVSSEKSVENSRGPLDSSEPNDTRSSYTFFRGENRKMELKIWEAVRATSAAPGYFKSFYHSASKYTFEDGALTCNNPIFVANKERKVLWPDLSKQDPDILLSIGTGFDPSPPPLVEAHIPLPKRGIRNFIRRIIKHGARAILEDMNCEIIWREFIESLGIDDNTTERSKKYQRLNPHLTTPIPKLDEVDKISSLRRKAQEYISHANVNEIANTLLGTLFYFELQSVTPDKLGGRWVTEQDYNLSCTGTIKCRVSSKTLAELMNNYENPNGTPKRSIFLMSKPGGIREGLGADQVPGAGVTDRISYDVRFRLECADKDKEMCIFLSLWGDPVKAVSISGFPRLLFSDAKSFYNY